MERDTWTDMVAEPTHAADGAQSAPQLIRLVSGPHE